MGRHRSTRAKKLMPTSGFEPLTSPLQVGRDNHYTKRAHLTSVVRYIGL